MAQQKLCSHTSSAVPIWPKTGARTVNEWGALQVEWAQSPHPHPHLLSLAWLMLTLFQMHNFIELTSACINKMNLSLFGLQTGRY